MALQVWIPLNNNVINVGLNHEEPITTGTITYTNGLFFGKCFSAGTGTITGKLTSIPSAIIFLKSFTVYLSSVKL